MRKSICLPLYLGILLLLISNFPGISQPRFNFNGLWKSAEDVLVHIKDTSSTITVNYLNPGDCPTGHNCVIGGGGEYYLKGTVSPTNKMELIMLRCTHREDMRNDGLAPRWNSPCKVTTVTNTSISGTARIEWYKSETRDGREVNFTRDPSQDFDASFTLTRTNCKKELEDLAAEVDQKAQSVKEQQLAIDEVSRSSTDAVGRLGEEVDEQIQEEIFNGVVPAPTRVVTTVYSGDPAGHIEAWTDLVQDLAESGGKIAVKTGTWIVSIFDLLIDLANLNAKGIVVVKETGQIEDELNNMRKRRDESFHSWKNSWEEFQRLKDLCEAEIPRAQQPTLGNSSTPGSTNDMTRTSTEASRIHSSLKADIEGAESTIAACTASINKLEQFLDPYRNANVNKTLKEIMTTAGVSKLQSGLIEVGNNWIKVLKLISTIEEKKKKLRDLSTLKVS